MKVIYFNTLYYPNIVGGAEKSLQLLAEKLIKYDVEPIIVTTYKEDKIDYINGVKVYYLHHRNLYWINDSLPSTSSVNKAIWNAKDIYNKDMYKKVEEIIKLEKPDVIHSNNLKGFSTVPWNIAKKNKIPVIHTLRDFSLMCPKSTMFQDGINCEKRCSTCTIFTEYKRIASNKYVDMVVGNSNFMVEKHKKLGYFKEVQGKRIFNGTPILSENIISDKKVEESKVKFFYMGRIEETKGVNLLLDTFKDINGVELVLAGRVYDDKIEENIKKGRYPEHIKFIGYANPSEILPEIDVLIAPSLWHEPLPRVILEAYSYGKFVIGSNRGGIPECIKEGITGYIFDPDIKNSLKSAIDKVLQNKEYSHNKGEILSYINEFDIEKSVNQYYEAYKSIMNG